jgi:hypothetical protein
MTYELAKQLKDAHFQEGFDSHSGGKWVDEDGEPYDHPTGIGEEFYIPTLSQLIEACMQLMKPKEMFPGAFDFFSLYPILNTTVSGGGKELGDIEEWGAGWEHGLSLDEPDWRRNFFGPTPEIAVAKLWLALRSPKANVT